MKKMIKSVISCALSAVITAGAVPCVSAFTEDTEKQYPYTMFAASCEEGAITLNTDNFCVNGNIATNGTIVSTGTVNVNGTKTENAGEQMVFIFDKIDARYFESSDIDEHQNDFILDESNINIDTPTEVQGETTLTGNICIDTALKSMRDVDLLGEVKNTNDSIIFSKYGNIYIEGENVNLNGLVYAPFGSVTIDSKNLTLNSVVIIADKISLTCPSVNVNSSDRARTFVGTDPGSFDIPVDEWSHLTNENGNGLPDFLENPKNWSYLVDTDNDKLPDCIEEYIGSDPKNSDTDNDGIDDCYEAFLLFTAPDKPDTDENGIFDSDEDLDSDGLDNLEEYKLGIDPYDPDTDEDGLNDGDEVNIYDTDPLKPDTDYDELDDADEIALGTDPKLADTDGDGIPDCDEKFEQTLSYTVENEDCAVEKVVVSMKGTGNIQTNTAVEDIMDRDVICSEVVGLVGEPFSIETSSEFDTATLTFRIDKSKLGDTEFDNLMFLWYDEENKEFVELETLYDHENSTISVETDHFSKYLIVDRNQWLEGWSREFDYRPPVNENNSVTYDTVICIDCSGSMSGYDISGINSKRAQAAENLISVMRKGDRTGIVIFDNTAKVTCNLTDKQTDLIGGLDSIYSNGGTSFNAALSTALTLFDTNDSLTGKKRIVLFSDGEDSIPYTILDICKERNVAVYTIGLGVSSDSTLEYIAKYTDGKFFKAYTADDLVDIYSDIGIESDFDKTDTDGDELYDIIETRGFRLHDGKIIKTDPKNPDSDNDGLSDGDEIDPIPEIFKTTQIQADSKELSKISKSPDYYFKMYSDPNDADTDKDGLLDGNAQFYNDKPLAPKDPEPSNFTGGSNVWKTHIEEIKSDIKTTSGYSNDYYKPLNYEENKEHYLLNSWLDGNLVEVIISVFSSFGSIALDFRYDDENIALHSDTTQWQAIGGYNDFYDWVFKVVTSMDKEKLVFNTNDKDYVIWAWKGNYLNLGAGSEVGFYTQDGKLEFLEENFKLEQWMVADELPMTLSLYNVSNNDYVYNTYYHWLPDEKQWWITGFVPDIYDQWLLSKLGLDTGHTVTEDELLQIASVDLSDFYDYDSHCNEAMNYLEIKYKSDEKAGKLIFDDDNQIVWMVW